MSYQPNFFSSSLLNWLWETSIDKITKETLLLQIFVGNYFYEICILEENAGIYFCEFDVSKNLILIRSVKIQKQRNIKSVYFVTFMHLYIKSLQNIAKMNQTLMKLNLVFFLIKKKSFPVYKNSCGYYFCESSNLKHFAATYFCKFGENSQIRKNF